ncbi:MAG: phosphoribosylformylglycinamidine synthase subunit PurQ, partial [Ezakiella massiliensis]
DNDQYKKTPLTVIVEYDEDFEGIREIGKSGTEDFIVNGEKLAYEDVKKAFVNGLNEIYGTNKDQETQDLYFHESTNRRMKSYKPVEKVRVVIPVFEGTNSEFDSRLAFEKEGAYVQEVLIKNLTPELLEASIKEFALAINNAQILFIPGGFSMSDEPDGSAKFIANVLRNKDVKEAIEHLVSEEGNDGLVLGVCNGFQALIKTGLLPFGQIKNLSEDDATLTFNTLGRHISRIITTKPQTLNSPWLKYIENREYRVPISHGEGRFYCSDEMYNDLVDKDQVAFKYVINPNGSSHGIESIIDPSGKILGKMGHSERVSEDTYKNIPDIEYMNLFKAGVEYFK